MLDRAQPLLKLLGGQLAAGVAGLEDLDGILGRAAAVAAAPRIIDSIIQPMPPIITTMATITSQPQPPI